MVQGVGKEEHFLHHFLIGQSGEAQRRMLTFEENIYASAENIAPDDEEHPSMYSQTSRVVRNID